MKLTARAQGEIRYNDIHGENKEMLWMDVEAQGTVYTVEDITTRRTSIEASFVIIEDS